MSTFKTRIVLGQKYKHKHSDIEGMATCVSFYLYGCVRVGLLPTSSTDNTWLYFDEAELVKGKVTKSGGPRPDAPQSR